MQGTPLISKMPDKEAVELCPQPPAPRVEQRMYCGVSGWQSHALHEYKTLRDRICNEYSGVQDSRVALMNLGTVC